METRRWWFKIETYHGNVTILVVQHTTHIMCKDLMSEALVNFRMQEYTYSGKLWDAGVCIPLYPKVGNITWKQDSGGLK